MHALGDLLGAEGGCLCVPCLAVGPGAALPADLLWLCQGQGLSGHVQSLRRAGVNRGNVSEQIRTTFSPCRTTHHGRILPWLMFTGQGWVTWKALGANVRFRVYCEGDREPAGFEAGRWHEQVGRMTCRFVQVLACEAVLLGPELSIVVSSSSVQLWTHLYILCLGTFVSSKGIFRLPHLKF